MKRTSKKASSPARGSGRSRHVWVVTDDAGTRLATGEQNSEFAAQAVAEVRRREASRRKRKSPSARMIWEDMKAAARQAEALSARAERRNIENTDWVRGKSKELTLDGWVALLDAGTSKRKLSPDEKSLVARHPQVVEEERIARMLLGWPALKEVGKRSRGRPTARGKSASEVLAEIEKLPLKALSASQRKVMVLRKAQRGRPELSLAEVSPIVMAVAAANQRDGLPIPEAIRKAAEKLHISVDKAARVWKQRARWLR